MAVGVFSKETTITGSKTSDNYVSLGSNIPSSSMLNRLDYWDIRNDEIGFLDWTEEREEFFVSLIFALENIILRLNDFLDVKETSKLIKIIDGNTPLLPSPRNKS